MGFPIQDTTSQTGSILANEGATITVADPTAVTSVNLSTSRFTSNFVPVSNVLIQDSVYDLTSHVTMQCARRIGRAVSDKIVNGTLSADGIQGMAEIATIPTGLNAVSKTAFPFVSAITSLIHSVDRGYTKGEMGLGSSLMAGAGLTSMGGRRRACSGHGTWPES